MGNTQVPLVMEEITEPDELAKARRNANDSIETAHGCKRMRLKFTGIIVASVSVLPAKNCSSPTHPNKR